MAGTIHEEDWKTLEKCYWEVRKKDAIETLQELHDKTKTNKIAFGRLINFIKRSDRYIETPGLYHQAYAWNPDASVDTMADFITDQLKRMNQKKPEYKQVHDCISGIVEKITAASVVSTIHKDSIR